MCDVRRIGGEGSRNGELNYPRQLTTDLISRVFIADFFNNRICVHDPDLNHLRNITHPFLSEPLDVKVSRDCLYVLCPGNNPCMLVLTLNGDMLHSLITCEEGMDVLYPAFFCLDPLNDFVLSDCSSHSIRVFSPEDNLLHTIRREGHQPGMFCYTEGVAITPNGRLVCVSRNKNYDLQIFTSLFEISIIIYIHIFTPVYSNFYISDSNSVARQEGVCWSDHLCQLVDRLVPLSFWN